MKKLLFLAFFVTSVHASSQESINADVFANDVKNLIKQKKWHELSQRVKYPTRINLKSKNSSIDFVYNQTEMSNKLKNYFSEEELERILTNNNGYTFYNSDGYAIGGRGEIWFNVYCIKEKCAFYITTINKTDK